MAQVVECLLSKFKALKFQLPYASPKFECMSMPCSCVHVLMDT
jgi:hypothetical protein